MEVCGNVAQDISRRDNWLATMVKRGSKEAEKYQCMRYKGHRGQCQRYPSEIVWHKSYLTDPPTYQPILIKPADA